MSAADAIAAIGEATEAELDAIIGAVRARRRFLVAQAAMTNKAALTPGTRVVTRNVSPKYLTGLHGTVVAERARRPGDITVEIDEAERYRLGKYGNHATGRVAIPAASLEAVA